MRRFLLGLGTVLLVGCAAPTPPVPVPTFQTPAGQVCARECQQMRTQCAQSCTGLPGWGPQSGSGCRQRCEQQLGQCYTTCE